MFIYTYKVTICSYIYGYYMFIYTVKTFFFLSQFFEYWTWLFASIL